jgi:hypothetical protein
MVVERTSAEQADVEQEIPVNGERQSLRQRDLQQAIASRHSFRVGELLTLEG